MQLKHYLTINDLYTVTQSAYHTNHSTKMAKLHVSNDINLALDNYDEVVLVLLDTLTQQHVWSERPGEGITSCQFFLNFTGCLYVSALFLRFYLLIIITELRMVW